MPRFVAFLRAINVSGRFIKMDVLRGHFEALKFQGVETFINSGNVIFSSAAKDAGALEAKIEIHLAASLGFIKTPLSQEQQAVLMGLKSAVDDFHMADRHVYWLCGVSQHESKFNNAVFERKLKTVATWRRVNTVQDLLAKHFQNWIRKFHALFQAKMTGKAYETCAY